MTDLADLVLACRGGDHGAFAQLVGRFQDMAFAVAIAHCGDDHLAQDVCQEAFITAFRELKAGRLEHPLAFPAWLRTVTTRLCRRAMLRERRAPTPAQDATEALTCRDDPAAALEHREQRQLVHQALRQLTAAQRVVIALFYLGSRSTTEIADFLQVPLTTVNKRLHDARRKLKESMSAMVDETLRTEAPSHDDRFLTIVALCHAADIGDTARVEEIIGAKPELAKREQGPGARDEEKRAIHYAAAAGHAGIVDILLRAGADPLRGFWPYRDATTPLALARERGHAEVVAVIERWLGQVGTAAGDALCASIASGDLAAVRSALAADPALIEACSFRGDVPLCVAARHDRAAIAKELVERGADVNRRDGHRCAPIHVALYRRTEKLNWAVHADSEVTRLLLAAGATRDCWVASALGDLTQVEEHVRRDPSVANAHIGADEYPWGMGLPLTMAALGGHEAVVRALLDAGADADARMELHRGWDGREHGLPLCFAASKGHLGIVRVLLERGAPAVSEISGMPTSASFAFQNGHDAVADLLVAHGDHIDFLALARRQDYDRMERSLLARPDLHEEADWQAAYRGDARMLGIVWSVVDRLRITLSDDHLYGCLRQSLRMADQPPSQRSPELDGVRVFSLMLTRLTNVDYHRGDGVTLLHHVASDYGSCATDDDRVGFAQALLERGARLDILDTEHQATALGWACRQGHAKLVAYFLEHGAKIAQPGDTGWNAPMALARQRGHAGIVRLLEAHGATR